RAAAALATHIGRVSRVRWRRARSRAVHQTGAGTRPDTPRNPRSRQSPIGRGSDAMSARPRPARTKGDAAGEPSQRARHLLRRVAGLPADVRPRPAEPIVDGLSCRRESDVGEAAMKKGSIAAWSDVSALTSAGTVAATVLCCLPFATGVAGAALAAVGALL